MFNDPNDTSNNEDPAEIKKDDDKEDDRQTAGSAPMPKPEDNNSAEDMSKPSSAPGVN